MNADPDAKRMLDDFRHGQMDLQNRMMAGDMPPKEEMERMEKLYEVLSLNAPVRSLFEAERRLSVMMEDIQRILAEPLQDILE